MVVQSSVIDRGRAVTFADVASLSVLRPLFSAFGAPACTQGRSERRGDGKTAITPRGSCVLRARGCRGCPRRRGFDSERPALLGAECARTGLQRRAAGSDWLHQAAV